MNGLQKIEKRILDVHEKQRQAIRRGKNNPFYDKEIENTLNQLGNERKFLLDRRESWLPKTIWMVLVPIIVSIVASILTLYVTKKLGFEIMK